MGELPEGFADQLVRVLAPSDVPAAAEIIEAATLLDDEGLARFLRLVTSRVAASAAHLRADELRAFLQQAAGAA